MGDMKILGIGTDIVETARIESSIERHDERFLKRVFTAQEIAYCATMKFPAPHYAARFAAKEAVSKAFGTGIGKRMEFTEIEVCRRESGEPFVALHGGAAAFGMEIGLAEIFISLSHSAHYAVATAVLVGE